MRSVFKAIKQKMPGANKQASTLSGSIGVNNNNATNSNQNNLPSTPKSNNRSNKSMNIRYFYLFKSIINECI